MLFFLANNPCRRILYEGEVNEQEQQSTAPEETEIPPRWEIPQRGIHEMVLLFAEVDNGKIVDDIIA